MGLACVSDNAARLPRSLQAFIDRDGDGVEVEEVAIVLYGKQRGKS